MDFQKLLKDLKDAGWTQTQIAEHCGTSQQVLAYYSKTGAEPKYSLGCKLKELRDFEVFRAARPGMLRG